MQLKNKRVLVTGAAGFIGSHLVEQLIKQNCKVKAFIRYNSKNNWGWLEDIKDYKKVDIYAGDIRDYDSVYNAMKNIDIVFHLAALIGIPYSYESPLAYIETNIKGAYNVLESARRLKIKKILITSTSETYGTAQYVPIDENHPKVGQSPYSASKIGADQIAISYFRSFNLPVVIARPFNTYGPRQSARAIIPTIITQILMNKNKIELGNLSPTRDFTYVLDTVDALIKLVKKDNTIGEEINIGSGKEISIKDLIDLIKKIMKKDIKIIQKKQRFRPNKSEVERLCCDNKKLKKYTDWEIKYSLEKGIKQTIKWIKQNLDKYKAEIYNI